MDPRIGKIAPACFAGGASTVLGLLIAVPGLGVFGLLIGFALGGLVGYLAYDFRQVYGAVSIAAQATMPRVKEISRSPWYLAVWVGKRPLLQMFLVLVAVLVLSAFLYLSLKQYDLRLATYWFIVFLVSLSLLTCMMCAPFTTITLPLIACRLSPEYKRVLAEKLGLRHETWPYELYFHPMSWSSVLMLHLEAVRIITTHIPSELKWIVLALFWRVPIAVGKFIWMVFRHIHSDLRFLCGIDSVLGGWFTFLLFRNTIFAMPLWMRFGVVVLGGLAAVGLGVANYVILSKHMLRTVPEQPA